jgi:hypothetical protein
MSGVTAMNSSFSSWEKRRKREKKRGDLCDLPAPESEVFSAAQRFQWAEGEGNIRNQVDWLKRRHGDSSLFLSGIKPNRVKRPANQIQDLEIRPKPIIRKVRSRRHSCRVFPFWVTFWKLFFSFPSISLSSCSFSSKQDAIDSQCSDLLVYFYNACPDYYSTLCKLPPSSCYRDSERLETSVLIK